MMKEKMIKNIDNKTKIRYYYVILISRLSTICDINYRYMTSVHLYNMKLLGD